jgi:branched-chain amino acid transport system permease protein
MDMNLLLQVTINGLLTGGVFAIIAIGLTLIFGVLEIVNFAHGEFVMLGMYASYFLFTIWGIDPYLSLLIVMPLFFFFGMLIQKSLIERVMKARFHIQILLTLGLMLFLQNFAQFAWTSDFRSVKLPYSSSVLQLGEFIISVPRLIACFLALGIAGGLYFFLKKTDLGLAIKACAVEKEGAAIVGINVERIFLIAFGVGIACAGAAGSILLPFFYVSPNVGSVFVLTAFVIVVLGGMGNFVGALLGGFIIGAAEAIGELFLPGALKQVVSFIIFILILFFRPMGLLGGKID